MLKLKTPLNEGGRVRHIMPDEVDGQPDRDTAASYVSVRAYWNVFDQRPAATVFVKDGAFFRSQGGLVEDWGKFWIACGTADLDAARNIGYELAGAKRPWFL